HPEAPIAGTGRLVVHNGVVEYLDGRGRDVPKTPEYLDQVVGAMRERGVDLHRRVLYPEGDPAPAFSGRTAEEALDRLVDKVALALDAGGRNPLVQGIEASHQDGRQQVRLILRDGPPVEIDLTRPVLALLERR